jgi:hypothetical protein
LATASCGAAKNEIKPIAVEKIMFDGDGDGESAHLALLSCLGASGGYGSYRLEIFSEGGEKIFDSEDGETAALISKMISENLSDGLETDSVYSVTPSDLDGDGCEELICRCYAWSVSHSNHVGDVIFVLKTTPTSVSIVNFYLEKGNRTSINPTNRFRL